MSNVHLPIQLSLNIGAKDHDNDNDLDIGLSNNALVPTPPTLWGIQLKYLSLVTLAVQNSALTIIMHYSRVSTSPSRTYSAATAVLVNEILKGAISLLVAFARIDSPSTPYDMNTITSPSTRRWWTQSFILRCRKLSREVLSPDCWKLSVPAILYVIQNNLQYVAASNLEAATFQVTYQMKILTTAAFSVLLLRRKLSTSQWLSLLFLAIGVGIVQIQAGSGGQTSEINLAMHAMNPLKGFIAVLSACFTSGLAGVYFEMVLKNSQTDLWVRNVQLSLFSLLPALAPIIFTQRAQASHAGDRLISALFENFGLWAWATVFVQVFGGLVTAMVIKYSDNILKGFATSLSIVLSFLASVALFDFKMSITFVLGSTVVLIATWLYNQHPTRVNIVISKDPWAWMKMEKQKNHESLRPPPPALPQFGSLVAISSTSSISSLSSSLIGTPSLSDSEKRTPIR